MKRIIYLLFVLALLSFSVNAQQSAEEGLKAFINDLMALDGENVSCEMQGYDSFAEKNITLELDGEEGIVDVRKLLGNLNSPEWQFLAVESGNRDGYNAVYNVLDKYDVMEADELFGIPLAVNTREDGHQNTVFVDDNNTLIIEESDFGISLIYTNCNIVNVLTQAMRMVAIGLDDYLGELVEHGFNTLTHIGDNWETEDNTPVENQPKCGYDFFNLKELKNKLHYADCVELITPEDVAMQYMTRFLPKEEWLDEGYSAKVKEMYKQKYPGGTPAVLYAIAKSESTYNIMTDVFGFLFDLDLKDVHNGLKVIQRSDRNGKRFIQLYGEGNVMLTILDIPATNYLVMTVTIGSERDFEDAVNAYSINGGTGIANKSIIVLNQNGIDVRLSKSNVEADALNGVRFRFELKEMFLK